ERPRRELARKFGAEATVDIERYQTADARVGRVRDRVGGFGADLVMDCSGHPSAGPEGIEFLRDVGTYVEMGQFTDAGAITTSWHRFCAKDINVLGSWGFTGNDLPLGVDMLYRAKTKYPWFDMQTLYPFSEDGIARAVADAMRMKTVKSTIMPFADHIKDAGWSDDDTGQSSLIGLASDVARAENRHLLLCAAGRSHRRRDQCRTSRCMVVLVDAAARGCGTRACGGLHRHNLEPGAP